MTSQRGIGLTQQHESQTMTSLSTAVVDAVTAETGTDATTLPPLYDVIDPDALDALFQGRDGGAVSFDYAGDAVTVRAGTTISLRQVESDGPPSE